MATALRTVVVARDRRYLRALARVLETQRAIRLCGFAEDLETATTVARAVRAQVLLLDARVVGVASAAWPAKAWRIFLVGDNDRSPVLRESGDACVSPDMLAHELGPVLARLIPEAGKNR